MLAGLRCIGCSRLIQVLISHNALTIERLKCPPSLLLCLQERAGAGAGPAREEGDEEEEGGLLVRLDEGNGRKASAAAIAAQWFAQFDDPDLAAEDDAAGGTDDPKTLNPTGPTGNPPAKRGRGDSDPTASVRAEAGVGGAGSALGGINGLAMRVSTARSAGAAAAGPTEPAGVDGALEEAGPASGAAARAPEAADGGFEEVPMASSSSGSDDEGGSRDNGAEESGSDAGLLDLDDQGRAEVWTLAFKDYM